MSAQNTRNDSAIRVKGARVHNLKNIDVTIPRDKFVVITGPSGSGKSSLAFDTIYAEGQRRYVESLSAYARQFLEQLGKPDVDSIDGLSPTISIEQRLAGYNPRSTVGTVTEIYDYLRLLFARIGKPYCWKCGKPIKSQSPQQIVDHALSLAENTRLAILAPIIRGRKGEHQKELVNLRQRGFVRVRIDGELLDLSLDIALDKGRKHDIDAFVDRLIIKGDRGQLAARVSDSVELALKLGEGQLVLQSGLVPSGADAVETLMSERFACPECNISYPPPEPRTFSFNSPAGACPVCSGIGIKPSPDGAPSSDGSERDVAADASAEPPLAPTKNEPCPECLGSRLKKESLQFRIDDSNIAQLSALPVARLLSFMDNLSLGERDRAIASRIIKEISERLSFLSEVGVGYLSLSRSAQSLSGGESQRIRLATQIGSSLVGVIYVLDEPSIGLHQRDNARLLATLERLRDRGNSVIVVEHDRETIERADWVLDLGPGAGTLGGRVIASGTPAQIASHKKSLTGLYLRGEKTIPVPGRRRRPTSARLEITGARMNNLKNIRATFPLGLMTCVTGVSGSGKSTLVIDTLHALLVKHLYRIDAGDLLVSSFTGAHLVDKVINIDQSPIGKTPRSNPATYTGMFGVVRELFSLLPDSRIRGYGPGRYSFNIKGGRCEACEGDGVTRIEMHFLPDVYVTCDTCRGQRYNRETLEIRFKGKSIADVLDMTASEALVFFDAVPQLKNKLRVLTDVGLGYIKLGQSATTLSGGEAQRIKLSRELAKRGTGKTVYILDEPTTGLHFDDVSKLVTILQTLVDQGNTVIVIEHNLDIIKTADYVIDMGPEGGDGGGKIVATGTPGDLARSGLGVTGAFLKGIPETNLGCRQRASKPRSRNSVSFRAKRT
ncbi:MAG: ABC-ATPase UvrA [Bdellovibrionales bacterium RIFOXYD1_FULL_53_11]|nr:MAG: ABC-ATPase UvrA [Bdellovibrionales bacterium RIFOXYD1_FULL_53_11]